MRIQKAIDKLFEMMASSVLTQSYITIALLTTCVYLWATGEEVPKELFYTTSSVVGFFFGGKYQQLLHRGIKQ